MPTRTVHLETFGCQMNELDSELVTGALRALGYRFTPDPEKADVVLYNTCSVRDHAEQKVRSRLGEMELRKREDPLVVVGVLGCMAERDGRDMLRRFPAVDILCGPGELDKLPGMVDNAVRTRESLGEQPRFPREVALQGNASRRSATLAAAADSLEMLDLGRSVSPDEHNGSAYVRITRGCNKFCTYCVVPNTRGAEVHRPPQHIVDECKRLADAGVVEVTLLGQTVNHYRFEHGSAVTVQGVVQPQKGRSYAGGTGGHRRDPFAGEHVTTFADLLKRIHDEVPSIKRLRFVTSYPRDFGDDVLTVIRDSPRICRYLHVPGQSGSDRVLAAMNRGYSVGEYLEFIDRAREALHQPQVGRPLTIAGDIIAGFCGETDADHRATIDLLRRVRYKNCFIFKYSPRPGTTAFDRLEDDVPEAVKRARVNELLAVQQGISDEISREHVGLTLEVFVQGLSSHAEKSARRASRDADRQHRPGGGVMLTIGGRSATHAESTEPANACTIEASHVTTDAADRPPNQGPLQLSGRTDGDLIVAFDCPPGFDAASLVGTLVRVRVERAAGLTMLGTVQ